MQRLSANDETWHSSLANVTFEPGARTNWHKHSGGQILLVLDGEGRYQERGKPVRILHKGDVVRIPLNVEHWHGAAPDSWFTHISVETNLPNNETTWLEPVTAAEYNDETRFAGGADSQVRSHAPGNLNMGNGRQVLLDTVTVLLPYIGYPRSLNAIAAVNEIAKE